MLPYRVSCGVDWCGFSPGGIQLVADLVRIEFCGLEMTLYRRQAGNQPPKRHLPQPPPKPVNRRLHSH